MLKGLITLVLFQLIGESISRLFSLIIPGPVIGMVLLFIFLMIRKSSFESLDKAVFIHLRYLPLILIPTAMGIITQVDIILKELWAILISLIIGNIIALVVSAKLMDYLTIKQEEKREF